MNAASQSTSRTTAKALRSRLINGWPLFWLLVTPMTAGMLWAMTRFDVASSTGVSQMIQYSVRWAVPFIYAVVAASALPVLFPGALSYWLLRNRRYVGLVFAMAMAWQGAFIFIVSTMHSGYYYDDIYLLRDELEGSSGYLFLAAMVLTSFRWGRRLISAEQWKILHRSGVYFLWAYPFSVYWWNLHYYKSVAGIDYVFYWAGFLAFAARIAAWGKRRWRSGPAHTSTQSILSLSGLALIAGGLLASATGIYWQPTVSGILTAAPWSARLELWLPFWPFEPFLPLLALGLGTWLYTGGVLVAASTKGSSVSATP